jgi:hypothetical protein
MALITKAATASLETLPFSGSPQGFAPAPDTLLSPSGHRVGPLVAGEALGALAPCYIKASDGLVYQSVGSAVAPAAKVHGYALNSTVLGGQVYLCYDFVAYYAASGLTPGAFVYLGTAAGTLDTAVTTGGTAPIGLALDGQRVLLKQSTY